MKISKETIKRFQEETGLFLYFGVTARSFMMEPIKLEQNKITFEECEYTQILGFTEEQYVCTQFKAPKQKEVNFEYLMRKLSLFYSKESSYKNLAEVFKKLVALCSSRFYVTSYGIGFDTFMLSHEQVLAATEQLEDYLARHNISFSNEYSDACWVYRFKIGKSRDNLERIKNL